MHAHKPHRYYYKSSGQVYRLRKGVQLINYSNVVKGEWLRLIGHFLTLTLSEFEVVELRL